jgi:UTP--glucose-1-phosphate uridylyltransferase
MSLEGLKSATDKMAAAGVHEQAIAVFEHYYHALEDGATGFIPEDTIEPLDAPPLLEDVTVSDSDAKAAFEKTVIIKLNGGLGTSMGMDKAKSLLPVRDGKSFLDLIVDQVLTARETHGAPLPLIFMNSFRTSEDTLAALAKYDNLEVEGIGLEFVQNQEPKLLKSDLTPVEWPDDPTLEWCPPGHGDLYTALAASGVLDNLLAKGYRYASVSNSDNLGAAPNATIAGWFAASGAPYAAEVCRRTPADRKGGHLAIRKADGQLILRDTAQTPKEEMDFFTDEHRHPYFHTNNLWFDLENLARTLAERKSVLGLPLIKNEKTVELARGGPDRDSDGLGYRGVRGRHGDRRRPGPVPAGEDHQRPAAASLRCVRSHRRCPAGEGGRPGAADRAGRVVLQDHLRLRTAVRGWRAVAQECRRLHGERGLDLRGRRYRRRQGDTARRGLAADRSGGYGARRLSLCQSADQTVATASS